MILKVAIYLLGGILNVAPFYGWDPKGFYLAPGGILKVAPFSGWDPKGSYLAPGGILKVATCLSSGWDLKGTGSSFLRVGS